MATIINSSEQVSDYASFNEKENRCNLMFRWALTNFGGIWHLCTPGDGQSVIFHDKEAYVSMMNLIATCSHDCPDIQIVTFEIMSNHLHMLLCGPEEKVMAFFDMLHRKLRFNLKRQGSTVSLRQFENANLIPVESLESIRNQIAYINRNNYVVDPDKTPFSYPFGANSYYYCPAAKRCSDSTLGKLTVRERRNLFRSRNIDYPDSWVLYDGYISPVNYVRLDIGEGLFRDARHYFHKISRDIESYKEIAAQLGDSIYYTDDELIAVLYRICNQDYNGNKPALLPTKAKQELARTLHFDYNADNGKIARLLKLDKKIVDEQFPFKK